MAKQSFNKWVKAAVVALAIAVPSLSQAASAYDSCDPCYNPCDPCASFCDMDFTVGVDFLYWKPCVDDLEYATLLTPSNLPAPTTTVDQTRCYQSVCLDWEPGFRVYVGLPGLCYDFDLNISYTWMRASTGASVASGVGSEIEGLNLYPGLAPIVTTPVAFDSASARYQLNYNEWDVLFSYRIACNPCHAFVPKFGVAGVVLDQEFRGQYDTATDGVFADFKATSDYWGVGLRVGSDYEYKLSRCLTFFAAAQGTILAGQKDNKDLSTVTDAGITSAGDVVSAEFKDDKNSCHLVPGYHLWIGMRYDDRMCDMDYFARIGYEFLNWWNVPNQRVFMGAGAGRSTSASVRTLGFHGLFLGAGVSF